MAVEHLITPEQIAREAAEAAVTVTREGEGPYHHRVWIGSWHAFDWVEEEPSREDAADARRRLAPLFLAAVERALREVPVPGGLSAERVAEVAGFVRRTPSGETSLEIPGLFDGTTYTDGLLGAFTDLLADNAHLRRALYDCGQDGAAQVWAAGYEAGREAGRREGFAEGASVQKGIDVTAAERGCLSVGESWSALVCAAWVAECVRGSAEATPPQEG